MYIRQFLLLSLVILHIYIVLREYVSFMVKPIVSVYKIVKTKIINKYFVQR